MLCHITNVSIRLLNLKVFISDLNQMSAMTTSRSILIFRYVNPFHGQLVKEYFICEPPRHNRFQFSPISRWTVVNLIKYFGWSYSSHSMQFWQRKMAFEIFQINEITATWPYPCPNLTSWLTLTSYRFIEHK